MPAQDTREEPTKHLKNISRLRLACVVAVVLVLIIVWANGLLDAAYRTYADPDWRTQLQKSPEQLIYSEQLADVHSRVSGTNSWILPIHIPAKGNCRISGFYVSDRYSLNLNVQSDTNFQDLFNGKRRSFTLEVESMEVMEPLEGRRRTSFDVHVPPGKRQLRLWIFHFLEGMATNFHLRANLNCWSGDVAFASQTWFQRIASLDLSPLGLPYPLW